MALISKYLVLAFLTKHKLCGIVGVISSNSYIFVDSAFVWNRYEMYFSTFIFLKPSTYCQISFHYIICDCLFLILHIATTTNICNHIKYKKLIYRRTGHVKSYNCFICYISLSQNANVCYTVS